MTSGPGGRGLPRPGAGRPPGAGQPRWTQWLPASARFALPALLLLLVAAGLHGVAAATGWTGPYHTDGPVVGGVLEAVLLAALAAVAVRGRRGLGSGHVAPRLRMALTYLLGAAVLVIPLVLLVNTNLRFHTRPLRLKVPEPLGTPHTPKALPPRSSSSFPLAAVLYGLLVAVIVLIVVLARRRDWLARHATGEFWDEPEELAQAVESGRAALRQLDDARAAIIACYSAMEGHLARAGTQRGVADTPDELLARAATTGLAHDSAARRLTALFYEARFSSHPMSRAQRNAAEQALTSLAAGLRRRHPGEPAPPPDPSGTAARPAGQP